MSKREKITKCEYFSLEDVLWLVNGYKFKVFRKDGTLTEAGNRAFDKLEDLLYTLAKFSQFDAECVVRELEQIIDSAY